jgi:aspartate/methionine/tyrosine aminotransferase
MPSGNPTHFSIYRRAIELERLGRKIYHLEVGDPYVDIDRDVIDEMCLRAKMGYIHYSDPKGIVEFREGIVEYLADRIGVSLDVDNILVSVGSKTALYLILRYLFSQGDKVVVFEPTWGVYRLLAGDMGIEYVSYGTSLEYGWIPGRDVLDRLGDIDFDVLILLNPSNPTGRVYDESLVKDLIKIVEEKDAYIIGDEVYFDTAFGIDVFPSVLRYGYYKTLALYSLSKSHALSGFRVGWLVGDKDIIDKLSGVVQRIYTNVPVFIQFGALEALSNRDIVRRNRDIYRSRVDILAKTLSELGFRFYYPEATFYIFAEAPKTIVDVDSFIISLLEDAGVAVAPGMSFGDYGRFIRFSASIFEGLLIEAMDRLSEYMRKNNLA